ncbi:MAG: hypothetical protein Q7R43_06810 [Candidatus Daviesbacteria bacterium]|nr:hypothetical protein [Candidatus Daviesbacteria bacterium]
MVTNSQDNEETKFYVDTNPGTFKWGMKLRPFILTKQSIFIGKNGEHIGIKKLFSKPLLWVDMLCRASGSPIMHMSTWLSDERWTKSNYSKSIDFDLKLFENIPYQDITTLSSHKLIGGDLVIDLIYNKNNAQKKISFFAVNEFNSRNGSTLKILNLLKSKVNL